MVWSAANIGIIATIIIYLVIMIVIGFYFGEKGDNSAEGFYLGGRKLGPLVAAMSAEASDMSSYLLMGLPGLAYISGIADVGWTAIGLAIGTYLNWLFVAKKLRRYSSNIGAYTVPDFFSRRYHDKKNILNLIAALVIIVFFVPYTASGFKAVGTLFNTLFGFDYHVSMIVGAIVIIGYTVVGGFLAVSTTDLVQSIVMTIALVIMVFFGASKAGGWNAVFENAKSLPGYFTMTETSTVANATVMNADGSTVIMEAEQAAEYVSQYATSENGVKILDVVRTASSYNFLTIISTLAWALGYFGMPHILLRFMAVRDENEIKSSRRIASIWVVISMGIAILIGIIGNAVSKTGEIPIFATSSDSETTIIKLADLIAKHGFLAALVAGLVMAGILACTMSTADSQLLTAGSAISQNFLQDFLKIKMKEKTSLMLARLTIVIVAVIAIFLAWNPNSSVFTIVSFAWAGFGAAFGPLMLLSLFWKRTNLPGAIAGMASGGIFVFIWKFAIKPNGGVWGIYELLPAFIVSLVVTVVVSLCTKAPSKEIVDEFEAASVKKNA